MLTQEMESPEQIAARQDEKLNGVFSSRLPQTAELDLTQRNSFRQSQKFAQQVRYHQVNGISRTVYQKFLVGYNLWTYHWMLW